MILKGSCVVRGGAVGKGLNKHLAGRLLYRTSGLERGKGRKTLPIAIGSFIRGKRSSSHQYMGIHIGGAFKFHASTVDQQRNLAKSVTVEGHENSSQPLCCLERDN